MKNVRLGVVGCGGMANGHMRKMHDINGVKLTAVCDCDPEAARKASETYGVPYFLHHEELIESGLCEAILIGTPHYDHPVIGIRAFESGLHVLSEKPICVTVSEADRFLAAARASGKVFAVMFQQRTSPDFRMARKIMESGTLGEIRRTMMVDTWFRSQAYFDSGGWRGTWAGEGGGIMLNQAPHMIDLFMLLCGMPKKVTARTRTFEHDIEVEDEADALLEYENGAWGHYYASTRESPETKMFEICGDKGKLFWRSGHGLQLQTVDPQVSKAITSDGAAFGKPKPKDVKLRQLAPLKLNAHAEVIRNFCRAIRAGTPLVAPGEQGIWTIEFINAVILSGYKKKPVEIPVNRDEYEELITKLKKTSRVKNVKDKRVTDPSTV